MMTKEQDNDELYMNDGDSCIEYRSLNDIRLRKEALRKSIEWVTAVTLFLFLPLCMGIFLPSVNAFFSLQ